MNWVDRAEGLNVEEEHGVRDEVRVDVTIPLRLERAVSEARDAEPVLEAHEHGEADKLTEPEIDTVEVVEIVKVADVVKVAVTETEPVALSPGVPSKNRAAFLRSKEVVVPTVVSRKINGITIRIIL